MTDSINSGQTNGLQVTTEPVSEATTGGMEGSSASSLVAMGMGVIGLVALVL